MMILMIIAAGDWDDDDDEKAPGLYISLQLDRQYSDNTNKTKSFKYQ